MLIWLDPSVLDADLNANINATHGIDCIICSAHRGEHFVIGDRHTLIELQKNKALSLTSRAALGHIIANYANLAAFSRTLATRITASHNKHGAPLKINATTWELPIETIGQIGISKAVLVAENLNDAHLFEHAALQYKARGKLFGAISITKLGGGGSTTPDCLNDHVTKEKRWVLCISDSDRLHPEQSMDLTAQKCAAIAATFGTVCEYQDIKAREIENIIPFKFLEEAIPPTHAYPWDQHCKQVLTAAPEAHEYGDLKSGTDLRKIFAYSVGSPQKIFWINIANTLQKAGNISLNCLAGGTCASSKHGQPCTCIVIHGYGEKILEAVVDNLSKRTPQKSCEMIKNDPNQEHWFGIGKRVFEWGCALPRIRS
ncbi:hypothetical protein [Roseateles sp.]|uniref:hypothetical protein n=1 Tax=Roseateles sp. TaxID=1971397 RepID=UPI002DF813CD|nr:hypothetical protein [Roseateles sp.]